MNFFLELKLAPYTLYNHIRVEMSEVSQTASIDQALAWFFQIMWRGPKDILISTTVVDIFRELTPQL